MLLKTSGGLKNNIKCACYWLMINLLQHWPDTLEYITWTTFVCLDIPSSNLVRTPILGSRWTIFILGSLGQRSMSLRSNVPKMFPINNSKMPWPTVLKLSPHIHPVEEHYWFQGHWVKGQDHKRQIFQNHFKLFKEQFPKMNFFIHLCNLFELTYPVVQNICEKNQVLGGIMF